MRATSPSHVGPKQRRVPGRTVVSHAATSRRAQAAATQRESDLQLQRMPAALRPELLTAIQAGAGNRAASRLVTPTALQRKSEYENRPPNTIEQAVGDDPMSKYLAANTDRLIANQQALQGATPASEEEAQAYRDRIERQIKLNAIGVMASHKATVQGREADTLESPGSPASMEPLRDAAFNLAKLAETKEEVEDYARELRLIEGRAIMHRGDLGDNLEALALSSNKLMTSSEKEALVDRFNDARNKGSADMMWLFLYGSAQYVHGIRQGQVDAIDAASSMLYERFPALSQMDPEDIVEENPSDAELGAQAYNAFRKVLGSIDDTIRDIHTGDIHPFDMPAIVEMTRDELPPSLRPVLDQMKTDHEVEKFWLNMGLTAAEILLAFVPVIGPALAFGVGAANLAIQGEEMLDQMQMAEAGANPVENPLGAQDPSTFQQVMLGVTAILSAVGAGALALQLRGGRAPASTLDEAAEALTREGAEATSRQAAGAGAVAEGEAAAMAGGGTPGAGTVQLGDEGLRLADSVSDDVIVLHHGTDQRGLEGLGGVGPGKISVTHAGGEYQDFSRGFYLSEDVSVAESAARVRAGQHGGAGQHVLTWEVSKKDLGVVVDVRTGGAHREAWDAYLDELVEPRMPGLGTKRKYIAGLGVEQRGVFFEEFLERINMTDADTIMGPLGTPETSGVVTSIHGESTQVVIRSQRIADRLNAIMAGE